MSYDAAALARRLDRAESRNAITDLIYGYARFIRTDEPERVGELFTPDAFFEIRDGHPDRPEHRLRDRHEGAAGIVAYLAPNKGKPHPIPLLHNIIVELDGDRATASSVMEAQIYGGTHRVCGEYRDTFRRESGRWYFASRTYTIFQGASSV